MKPINIKFIPQCEQRYNTVGDYWETEDSIEIRITAFEHKNHGYLILVHELIEMILCRDRYIFDGTIDDWDMNYTGTYTEPGDDPKAPYHKEHVYAGIIERLFAHELQENWDAYDNALDET